MRPLVVLAFLLAMPSAASHPGDEFEVISAEADGIAVSVSPQTLVMKAERPIVFRGEAYDNTTFKPIQNATFGFDAVGPAVAGPVEFQSYGSGFGAEVTFPAPGGWSLSVVVNGSRVDIPLTVWPASGVRVVSSALQYSFFYAGRESKAGLYFVEDVNGTLLRQAATVTARVERWENATKLGETIVALEPTKAVGEFTFRHEFESEGEHRISIASPVHGIDYGDLPPFKSIVRTAREGTAEDELDSQDDETPGFGVGAIMALAVVAFLVRRQ